ncbi:M3 family oligoendopeptidase [Pararhodospirillum photometricum]|uniref:Peptidase M3B, oligoendopeptidase-related clade 3 n=1 Tax=Pararhodospirillum photometricum DSM 122 TaxID=1150469 RepID=H6SJL1_PARPM|nr:M3 family oligoendopeptidase [Pararhodospirillum photometricum]CCG08176.1 Peptidase M3B, oligoendopeptidase-related clade 3 [Pararhodospirillum photometricum DSM 122]
MTHGTLTAPDPAALPAWDLSDLYDGPDSPRLRADLDAIEHDAEAFRTRYLGKVGTLDGAALGEAVQAFEALSERLYRVLSYAQLLHAGDMTDVAIGQFHQAMSERGTRISSLMLFFTLDLNLIDEDTLAQRLQDPALGRYAPWIRDLRLFRDHQLSDDMERLLNEKDVAGRSAWMRLFDETIAHLSFAVDGETLTSPQAFDRLSDPDRERRRSAAKAIGETLEAQLRLFSRITNTLALDKRVEDTWRRYPHPLASRNLSNKVEDTVVDALVTAVRESYPVLSHRYYRLKAKWFGVDTLDYWDRNAPLPDSDQTRYTWDAARDTVLGAYAAFSPELAALGQRFFDNAWIDAGVRPGKAPGAFAHPTVPSAHPYLLVNFMGSTRDVMTLAHELGHGVHQLLAAKQGTLLSDTPLTLAETASVFGEMLTFRALLDGTTDPRRRRIMLASKVEDMINTVVRQIAFHTFEEKVHHERQDGELSPERLCEIWLDVQKESLGPAFRFDPEYRVYWSYIPHFIHSPFYVYAYAFGDCLVNALYATYQKGDVPDFQAKYLDMLSAGGTLRHRELLAPFGLDASDPAFWRRGLGVLQGFIDELEQEG